MGLLSIFRRRPDTSPHVSREPPLDVQQARTRARQRLIGATILVAVGVVGFPLVFETQPRPIAVDIPIEIPRKEGAPALAMPPARAPARLPVEPLADPPAGGAPAIANSPATGSREEIITEAPDKPVRASPAASRSAAEPAAPPASKPIAGSKPPVVDKPSVGAKPASPENGGARAKALLDGKEPAAPVGSRFVVQVGAFADAGAAREVRAKVEGLGLKTYTQVADTPGGPRIRVRAGPFASRDEADKALAKARGAGLAAVVLTL